MARQLLKDTCELAAEILDGKHDANLDYIMQATQARQKRAAAESGIRKGGRVRVTAEESTLAGRVGTVERINQKTVSIQLDPLDENDWRTGWRVPHAWLEAA